MKSAREIACTPEMGDCGVWYDKQEGHGLVRLLHSFECDARTEAIQAAREDGARWAQQAIIDASMPEGDRDVTMTFARLLIPANARSVAPRSCGAGCSGIGGRDEMPSL